MGGGMNISLKEMNEIKEFNSHLDDVRTPYIKGFQTPSLADPAECTGKHYPEKLFKTIGTTYAQYIQPQVKECTANNVKFSIIAGQSVIEGKVKKSCFKKDEVTLSLKGRTNEVPVACDTLTFTNNKNMFSATEFRIYSSGAGFEFVNENNVSIERPEGSISHPGKGGDLRLLNHLLHIENSLKNQTTKVQVAPLIK